MKKILSLFKRDYEGNRQIYNEVVEGAEWVIAGEGLATVKFDGTSCMIRDGKLYRRYDAKNGKTPPVNFEASQEPDPITGHWTGWIPVGESNEDKWHREGLQWLQIADSWRIKVGGTFELVGEKIQNNPYQLKGHELWPHGSIVLQNVPTDFDGLREWFEYQKIEGVVWHHDEGRMVKIKRRDFGLEWPIKSK